MQNTEDFAQKYGFEHDCTCNEDFENGNADIVTRCYLEMSRKAMYQCEYFSEQMHKARFTILQLRQQVKELGDEPRA